MYGSGGYTYPGQQPNGFGAQQASPDVQQWFNMVDTDHSGKINSKELQAALVNGQGQNFSMTACELMILLFDKDKDGTIGVDEFQQLYNYINQWLGVFRIYDRDQSGSIEESELSQALTQMGFRLSEQVVKYIYESCTKNNPGKMSVDQFIICCVQIQRFTEEFRKRDTEMKGSITIAFEEFLGLVLSCSLRS